MSIKQRFEYLLEGAGLSQTDFAAKAAYSRAALSNFLNDKTKLPKADFFIAVKQAFPTLNLNWFITGQGDIWDGPAPDQLKDLQLPKDTTANPEQALIVRLLTQKLKEIAQTLREKDPALYEQLGLEELMEGG